MQKRIFTIEVTERLTDSTSEALEKDLDDLLELGQIASYHIHEKTENGIALLVSRRGTTT